MKKKIALTVLLGLFIGISLVCSAFCLKYLIINIQNFVRVGISGGNSFVSDRIEQIIIFTLSILMLLSNILFWLNRLIQLYISKDRLKEIKAIKQKKEQEKSIEKVNSLIKKQEKLSEKIKNIEKKGETR